MRSVNSTSWQPVSFLSHPHCRGTSSCFAWNAFLVRTLTHTHIRTHTHTHTQQCYLTPFLSLEKSVCAFARRRCRFSLAKSSPNTSPVRSAEIRSSNSPGKEACSKTLLMISVYQHCSIELVPLSMHGEINMHALLWD